MKQNLIACRSIGERQIERHDASRIIVIDRNFIVRFTQTEYKIFFHLLERQTIPDKDLIINGLQYARLDVRAKENLDKHIDNIRSKIRPGGLDIFRILRYNGYMLGESTEEI